MTPASLQSISEQMASQAEFIVNNLQQTGYQHDDRIDVDSGIYDCDCNGFVAFILERAAPNHYALIPKESDQPRPCAFEYCDFFSGLTPESPGGWRRIDLLPDARRGDILAWRFAEIEKGHNTGHVVIIADAPATNGTGNFAVRVYDSAALAHYEDTRGDCAGDFQTGIGSGFVNFQVDGKGRPTAF